MLAGTLACDSLRQKGDSSRSLDQLGHDVAVKRVFSPRLSVRTTFAPCNVPSSEQLINGLECVGARELPEDATRKTIAAASTRLTENPEPAALHTLALSDLVWGTTGKSMERSISYLSMASRVNGPNRVPALTDLSAALMVRAQRSQDVRALFQSIEAADSAVQLDSVYLPARFNLALSLEIASVDKQAISEWNNYLHFDSTSEWATEAKHRRDELLSKSVHPPKEPSGISDTALIRFAGSRQEARLYGWNTLLQKWGELTLQNNSQEADSVLKQIRTIAAATARSGGDGSLASAVAAIEATSGRTQSVYRLARAHVAYANAQVLYQKGEYPAAAVLLKEALTQSIDSKSLNHWASLSHAATLVYAGKIPQGLEVMSRIHRSAEPGSPAVKARALWMLGTTHMRSGLYEKALGEFLQASRAFDECGEHEYAGVTLELAADSQLHLGDATNAYSTGLAARRRLRSYRPSVWIHNLFAVTAAAAADEGFGNAAFRLQSEGLDAAIGVGIPLYLAEAHLARARIASQIGDHRVARRDIDTARAIIEKMPAGGPRTWFTADLALTTSRSSEAGTRAVYRARLDSTVATFEKLGNKLRILPALLGRADAAMDAHDLRAAQADLKRAADLVASERDSIASVVLRQSILGTARDVFTRAVALTIAQGDTVGAFRLLEQSRSSFSPAGGSVGASVSLPRMSNGVTAVEFMLRPDTLFAWTVTGKSLRFTRRPLNGYSIPDSVNEVTRLLESGSSPNSVEAILRSLYRELVYPITPTIEGADQLVFTGGDWVLATPFSALRNSANGRYLIQDHVVSVANRLEGSAFSVTAKPGGTVLLVGDASLDRKLNPGLDPLPGAAKEIESIATFYNSPVVLSQSSATVDAFRLQAAKASVIHYAGHAVADPLRPMQSYLPLRSGADAASSGRLTADVIQRTRTSAQVVVLSACETSRPPFGSNLGVNGLTLGFLAAGAKSVVGSLWRVDDEATRELMTTFHRSYSKSGNAGSALRAAQMEMISSRDIRSRSPAAWAAFQHLTH